jgi:hypothetical protein
LTLTEKDFRKRSKNGGDGGTGVCMQEGTTSRVKAADRPWWVLWFFRQSVYNALPDGWRATLGMTATPTVFCTSLPP